MRAVYAKGEDAVYDFVVSIIQKLEAIMKIGNRKSQYRIVPVLLGEKLLCCTI